MSNGQVSKHIKMVAYISMKCSRKIKQMKFKIKYVFLHYFCRHCTYLFIFISTNIQG